MRADRAPADRFDRRLLPPLMLGAILNPVNSSIIAVALVPIGAAFGASVATTAWLVSGLYLATAIGQPLTGWLVDRFGPRRIFLIGAVLVTAAGVLGATAGSVPVLVAARVVLGLGTCAGYPAAMYLIRAEAARTGLMSPAGVLTALSVTRQTISVIGPTLGGALVHLGGWPMTFAINVPLGILSLILGLVALPRTTVIDVTDRPPRFDPLGALLFSAALTALMLYLMNLHVATLWLLALSAVLWAGFGWWEARRDTPFIDVRVLAGNVPLVATFVRSVLAATVSYCYLYGFTQWLEQGRGLTPAVTGLVLIPTFGIGIAVAAAFGRRPEVRAKLWVGSAAQVVVSVLLVFVAPDSPLWFICAVAAVMGVPQGLVNLANQNALYHQSDPARTGASAGLLRTFMYIGAMLAAAATRLFFPEGGATSMRGLAWFMVAAASLLLVLSVVDRSLRRIGR